MPAVGCTMTAGGRGCLLGERGEEGLECRRINGILVTRWLGVVVLGFLAHHLQSSHVPKQGFGPGTGQWRCPIRLSPCAIISRAWAQPVVSVAALFPQPTA